MGGSELEPHHLIFQGKGQTRYRLELLARVKARCPGNIAHALVGSQEIEVPGCCAQGMLESFLTRLPFLGLKIASGFEQARANRSD